METIRIAGAQIPINDHDIDFNFKEEGNNLAELDNISSKPDFICCSKAAFESKECKELNV